MTVVRIAEGEAETAVAVLCHASLSGICDGVCGTDFARADIHHDLVLDNTDFLHDFADVVKVSVVEGAVAGKRYPLPLAMSCRTRHNEASMALPFSCKLCISMGQAWSSTFRLGYGQGTANPGCDVHKKIARKRSRAD